MQYQSPLHIIKNELVDANRLSPDYLKQLKKQKLLELQMYGGELQVGENSYTKDDILKAFDQLEDPTLLKCHAVIWGSEGLHDYLVKGELTKVSEVINTFQYNPLLKDEVFYPQFKAFVSPYIAYRINKEAGQLLREVDFDILKKHTELFIYVANKDKELALENIKYQIEYYTEKLDALEHNRIPFDAQEFKLFAKKGLYEMLNLLPEEMGKTITQFARDVINSCITVEKNHLTYVYAVYTGFRKLIVDDELQKIIEGNYQIYKRRYDNKKSGNNNRNKVNYNKSNRNKQSTGSGKKAWGVIVFIVMLIVFGSRLIRVFNRSSNYNSYDNEYYDNDFQDLLKELENEGSYLSSEKNANFEDMIEVLNNDPKAEGNVAPTLFDSYFRAYDNRYDSIVVDNKSKYDIVVLSSDYRGGYKSNIISKQSIAKIPQVKGDFVLYMGNNWSDDFISNGDYESIKGGFTKTSEQCKEQLLLTYKKSYAMKTIVVEQNKGIVEVGLLNMHGTDVNGLKMKDYVSGLQFYVLKRLGYGSSSSKEKDRVVRNFDEVFPQPVKKEEDDKVWIHNLTKQEVIILNNSSSTQSGRIKALESKSINSIDVDHNIYIGRDWRDDKSVKFYQDGNYYDIRGAFYKVSEQTKKLLQQKQPTKYGVEDVYITEDENGTISVRYENGLDKLTNKAVTRSDYKVALIRDMVTPKENKLPDLKVDKNYPLSFSNMFTKDKGSGSSLTIKNKTNYEVKILTNGTLKSIAQTAKPNGSLTIKFYGKYDLLIGKKWNKNKQYQGDSKRVFIGGYEEPHPNLSRILNADLTYYGSGSVITIREIDGNIELVEKPQYGDAKKIAL